MVRRLLISGFLLAFQASPSLAGGNPAQMITTGYTSQPIGHYYYCKLYKSDCQIFSLDTNAPKLTRERWNDLVSVNTYSNNSIAPYSDLEIYNKEEFWTYPTNYGDCEDYVLMKRYMLIKRGWPVSSLLITVVRRPNGEGHAVLTVRTDKADYILDNLESKIRPWNKTPYTFLKRQDIRHSGRWADIRDRKSPSS